MAKLPTVAIIGRPNTGKSTLFNRLVGRRKAIVSDVPGTTRDQIAHRIEGEQVDYLLIDTGGMGGGTVDKDFEDDVEMQSQLALRHADLIILTLNSQEELTSSDYKVVEMLRKNRRMHVPVILALTKCDNPLATEAALPQFYELAIGDDVIPVSAPHALGIDDLQACIVKNLLALHFAKDEPKEGDQVKIPSIAIIGRPNVGKSSIINAFMSDAQRDKSPLLVSEIAGTTRDTTDTLIKYEGKEYLFMDTAGIRKNQVNVDDIESYSVLRSIQAIEHCDVAVLVLDATLDEVGRQDKRIAGMAIEAGKGLIVLLNKMDAIPADHRSEKLLVLDALLPFCRYAPKLGCSAKTRYNLLKLFGLIDMTLRSRERRVPVKELRRWYEDTLFGKPMKSLSSGKHITQAADIPPAFVVFVKDPKAVQPSQLRYLENSLRKTFGFEGTPIKWIIKSSLIEGRGKKANGEWGMLDEHELKNQE